VDPRPGGGAGVTGEPSANPSGIFRTRVEWIDTDAAGIYHNSTVTRFVEAAEARLMSDHGPRIPVDDYFQVAPRVRYEVDFLAPLYFAQEVTTIIELARLGTSSMTFTFEVWGEEFRGQPRYRAAHGSYVTVHIDRHHGDGAASAPWPQPWVSALTSAGAEGDGARSHHA
jgi:acyl-CoA thioester hydrolase